MDSASVLRLMSGLVNKLLFTHQLGNSILAFQYAGAPVKIEIPQSGGWQTCRSYELQDLGTENELQIQC